MGFTAHIRESDHAEQTVSVHCRSTAERAAAYGDPLRLKQAAYLAGLLHDLGKQTKAFDDYIHQRSNLRRGELDHSYAGAKYLAQLCSWECTASERKAARLLARVILSHHGLHDWLDRNNDDYFGHRIEKDEYYDQILQNSERTATEAECRALLSQAAVECQAIYRCICDIVNEMQPASKEESETITGFYRGMLERLLESILIDADRTDTADFVSDRQTERQYDTAALWNDMQQRMETKLAAFADRTDRISKQRQSISERCAAFAENPIAICRLIVPTGGGKTLSSLRFAIEYCKRYGMKKIIYLAPYMSILEQNSDEIRAIAGDDAFLEHHSNAFSEEDASDGELRDYELRTEQWDSPVIATTMVQFFNALFSGKTASVRRMHRLSHAVIIIDEVQSVPAKCVYLFNLAVNFLSHICGSTIVLCSATQPLFDTMKRYPMVPCDIPSMTGETAEDFDVFHRTELIPLLKKGDYSYDEAADFCLNVYTSHGSLLVIVNTKQAAKELYGLMTERAALRSEDACPTILHLSTAMCPQHRREAISRMKKLLSEKQPLICVTTQLIEAGVDISFSAVVRSMAGMDNAAQAAGRCNRHGEHDMPCPVYLRRLYEEKLSALPEITMAQDVSRQIIDISEHTDYQGTKTMEQYFHVLYARLEREKILYYRVNNGKDDLVDLLSLSREQWKHWRHKAKRSQQQCGDLHFCTQAFHTAGEAFHVIENDTTDVLVPYNDEAEALILMLNRALSPAELKPLLRKAQKYMVGISSSVMRQLCDAQAVHMLPVDIRVLDARFYHTEYGVTMEGEKQPALIY